MFRFKKVGSTGNRMTHDKKLQIIGTIFLITLALLVLFMIRWAVITYESSEVLDWQKRQIATACKKYPSIHMVVNSCLADGIITRKELSDKIEPAIGRAEYIDIIMSAQPDICDVKGVCREP